MRKRKEKKIISAAAMLNIKSLKANDLYVAQRGEKSKFLREGKSQESKII